MYFAAFTRNFVYTWLGLLVLVGLEEVTDLRDVGRVVENLDLVVCDDALDGMG